MSAKSLILTIAAFAAGSCAVLAQDDATDSGDRSTLRAQVLLDRAGFSPGLIDGKLGENTRRAILAFQDRKDLNESGKLNSETWEALDRDDDTPALVDYNISNDDVDGPFTEEIPAKLEQQADLDELSFVNAKELIAEKFHMDEGLLQRLNGDADFDEAGETIRVANVGERMKGKSRKVDRIEVDNKAGALFAYDANGDLVAVYPATVGSRETPSPEGSLEVTKISRDPTYTYDPEKLDFKEVETDEKFSIAAGPNNPVGVVWIALNEEGYGIHGSPNPDTVSKAQSHGCVRLTNWDALELAGLVRPGVKVDFLTGDDSRRSRKTLVEVESEDG